MAGLAACGGSESPTGSTGNQGGSPAAGGSGPGGSNTAGGGSNPGGSGGGGGGGGVGGDEADGYKSGSRLKLEWYDYDGTRTLRGIYDGDLSEECNITTWADGKSYCAPTSSQVYYTDAACTAKVTLVYHPSVCPAPAPDYAVEYKQTMCSSPAAHLYERGAKTAQGANYYRAQSDGSCAGPYSGTSYDFYAVGDEVPTTKLVEIKKKAGTGTGRYVLGYQTGSDGFQVPDVVTDTTLDSACYFEAFGIEAKTAICFPGGAYRADYFHDAACTVPEIDVGSCGTPSAAYTQANPECNDGKYTFLKLGPAVTSTPLFQNGGGTCAPVIGDPSDVYYTTTGKLTVPDIERKPDTVAGRSIQIVHEHANGAQFRDYALHDADHGVDCYNYPLADGSFRCFPESYSVETFYSDAACTAGNEIDLMEVYVGSGGNCTVPPPSKYGVKGVAPSTGQCNYDYQVYKAGAAYTSPVYSKSGASCYAASTTYKYFSTSAMLPASEFSKAKLTTDK